MMSIGRGLKGEERGDEQREGVELKKTLALLAVVLVALASCTPSYSKFRTQSYRWTKPDYDFQRFINDESICRQKAESLPPISKIRILEELEKTGIGPPIHDGMKMRKEREKIDLYKQCLESMGYVWK